MYQILYSKNLSKLQDQVNKIAKEGWKPQGGITIGYDSGTQVFYQTLFKIVRCTKKSQEI